MTGTALALGLIAADGEQLQQLRQVVTGSGHKVAAALCLVDLGLEDLDNPPVQPVDAWLVELDLSDPTAEACEQWLAEAQVPVIYGDGDVPAAGTETFRHWQRRLEEKMQRLPGVIRRAESGEAPRQVWVLAASTGGPEAVRAFMQALPPGIGIAFVYAQHIDQVFNRSLVQAISQGSHYPAFVAGHGDLLQENAVAIVSAQARTQLLDNGTFAVSDRGWGGRYRPAIDEVLGDVARALGERAGAIIFSGMGEDGAAGCRLLKQAGGEIWVQSPQSCTVSSMPDAALATGTVSAKGEPEQLAKRLGAWRQWHRTTHRGAMTSP